MATETWPGLPNPSVAYSIEAQNEVLETRYETGEPLQRLRFDTHFDVVSVTWLFTDADYLIFKNWFATKIERGTKKFDIVLPLGDNLQTYEAQWVSGGNPYQVSYQQVLYWNVTATLRIQDTKEISEAVLDILIEEYPDATAQNFINATDALDNYIEVTLPGALD